MPVALGMFLAFANLVVCAIGIDLAQPSSYWCSCMSRYPTYYEMILLGTIPAVFVGAVLGACAGLTAHKTPWRRHLWLVPSSLEIVWWLGTVTDLERMVPYCAIPTLVACAILERRTRESELVEPDAGLPRAFGLTRERGGVS